jgi:hypothetical protein
MLHAIIESNIRPAILIPLLEEMMSMEMLMQSEHKRTHNEIELIKSEIKITQIDMLLHLLRFKAAA